MKPGSFVPFGKLVGAAETVAQAGAQRVQSGAQARSNEVQAYAHDLAIDDMLLTQTPDTHVTEAYSERGRHRTMQVTSTEATKQDKERTKRLLIKSVVGLVGGAIFVGGGVVVYGVHEARGAADAVAGGLNNGAAALQYAFTPHDVSAMETQNVVDIIKFPGFVPLIEQAHMKGTNTLHVDDSWLHQDNGSQYDIPVQVCGNEQVHANFGDPGMQVTAVKGADGTPELSLQVPVGPDGALTAQFVDDTSTSGSFESPCPDPSPTPGLFNPVGPQQQGDVHQWEKTKLQAVCGREVTKEDELKKGLGNTLLAFYKYSMPGVTQFANIAGVTPEAIAKLKYVESLVPNMKVTVNFVKPIGSADKGNGIQYVPVALSESSLPGIPPEPSGDELAKKEDLDPRHLTMPGESETSCLWTGTAVEDELAALGVVASPTVSAGPSPTPTLAGATN